MMSAPGLCPGATLHVGQLFRIDENKTHINKSTADVFNQGRLLVFGGPAPFSRLDTEQAIEYQRLSDEFLACGLDEIIGLYCQDAFVMKKFQEHISSETGKNNITFWGDGDGSFALGHGMSHNFVNQGLGMRSLRWAAIVFNGAVEYIEVDDYSQIDNSSANKFLNYLKNET
jgi:peroxiredoxin